MTRDDRTETRRALAWLALLCIPLFFVGLGSYDLNLRGEPREGLTAWAAIHEDFLLPVLNGELLPEKPVLFPWLVAAAMQVFGETSEWALRMPSALAATGLVLVVFGLGRRLISTRGGLLAASATSCTFLVVKLARSARVDMTLSFFVCATLLLFLVEFQRAESDPQCRPSTGRVLAFWLCLALGTMTKGPLAVILVVLAAAPFLVVRRQLAFVRRMRPLLGVVVLLALPGAWYAHGLAAQGRAFGFRTFLMENVLMFFGAEGGGGHRHGPFYFIPDYLFFGLPWSVLFPASVVWAVRRGRGGWRREPMLFPLGWFAAMFVFFSIASGKRQDYLLPLMPAASLLVAGAAESAVARGDESARRWFARCSWTFAAVVLVALVLIAAAVWAPSLVPAGITNREGARELLDCLLRHEPAAALVFSALLLASLAVPVALARRSGHTGIPFSSAALAVVAAVACAVLRPDIDARDTFRPFAAEIVRVAGKDATIRRYGGFEHQLFFYLHRIVPPITTKAELDAFLDQPCEAWIIANRLSLTRMDPARRARLEPVAEWLCPGQKEDDTSVLLRRLPASH